ALVASPAPRGRSAARNLGLRAASSKLVALLDDDDRLLPGALAARVAALSRHPQAVLVYGRAAAMDAAGKEAEGGRRAAARGAEEAALPAWTARYFDDPRTPAWARAMRPRLEGRHLNWIARNYRHAGDLAAARRCFLRAVRLDPTLLLHPRRLLRFAALGRL